MIEKYDCENCGSNLDINPIMVRIVCPYCGTVYINNNPMTLEKYDSSGMVFNNYEIKITKTDSKAIYLSQFNIEKNGSIRKLGEILNEETVINILSKKNKNKYYIIAKSNIYKEEKRVYMSCDKNRWKCLDKSLLDEWSNSVDSLVLQAEIKKELREYVVSEINDINMGAVINKEKARIFNPGVWERIDKVKTYFIAQKQVNDNNIISTENQEIIQWVKRVEAKEIIPDISEKISINMKLLENKYMEKAIEEKIFFNIFINEDGVITKESSIETDNLYYANGNVNYYFKQMYGTDSLRGSMQVKAFLISLISKICNNTNHWRIYSISKSERIYGNNQTEYLVRFICNINMKRMYKQW